MGIHCKVRGNEALAACPNPEHLDRKPSWSCNIEDGRHNCFSCGFGGSFAYLVQKMLGLSRGEAEGWVTKRKIQDVVAGRVTRPRQERAEPGISEAEMWRFTDPPANALDDRGIPLAACREYGVKWDASRELWITPVRDPATGKLWGWQEKNARHFRNHPVDLPKSRALFGVQSLGSDSTAVLVESPLDVCYLWAGGIDGCVSGYGVSVSDEQVHLLRRRALEVVIAFDNDRAGWKGVRRIAYGFGTMGVRVFNYGTLHTGPGPATVAEDSLDGRDPGNLTDDELAWGLEHAVSIWRLRIPWLT